LWLNDILCNDTKRLAKNEDIKLTVSLQWSDTLSLETGSDDGELVYRKFDIPSLSSQLKDEETMRPVSVSLSFRSVF